MPDDFRPDSPTNYGDLYRLEELPAAFRRLPHGATITWRDNLLNAWNYPPEPIKKQVEHAATATGVSLDTIPSFYHHK